jgi:methanogenic corrinoid protein MtbC1
MTAKKLAARFDLGLEYDRSYEAPLAAFCALVVRTGVRVSMLRDFLRDELPADRPDMVEIVFIEAVARQLGKKWISGDCDFIDVTIGTARLQEIIKSLSFEYRSIQSNEQSPSVVLLTPFGEQHTLMPHLLGLLFDAMGWSSQIFEGKELKGPYLRPAVEQADIVCIGWSNQRLKGEFKDLVTLIRSDRRDKRLPIVVGGAAALDSIDFLVSLGIDCICDSVYAASRICESYYELESIGHKSKAAGRSAVVNASGIGWLAP